MVQVLLCRAQQQVKGGQNLAWVCRPFFTTSLQGMVFFSNSCWIFKEHWFEGRCKLLACLVTLALGWPQLGPDKLPPTRAGVKAENNEREEKGGSSTDYSVRHGDWAFYKQKLIQSKGGLKRTHRQKLHFKEPTESEAASNFSEQPDRKSSSPFPI